MLIFLRLIQIHCANFCNCVCLSVIHIEISHITLKLTILEQYLINQILIFRELQSKLTFISPIIMLVRLSVILSLVFHKMLFLSSQLRSYERNSFLFQKIFSYDQKILKNLSIRYLSPDIRSIAILLFLVGYPAKQLSGATLSI